MIAEGHWKSLVHDGEDILIADLIDRMQDTYHFDNDVANRIVFNYRTYPMTKVGGKQQLVRLYKDDGYLLSDREVRPATHSVKRDISIHDFWVEVMVKENTIFQEDITCDSEFMMNTLDEIGDSIRKSFHFVPQTEKIHLFMDNAGGHGTIECKLEFEAKLKKKYNVIVNWQVPQSPETNLLDLGVWMSLQSLVERIHRFTLWTPDLLHISVMKAWTVYNGYTKFRRVNQRWKEVLALIIEDKGGNEKVEQCRTKLTKLEHLPPHT